MDSLNENRRPICEMGTAATTKQQNGRNNTVKFGETRAKYPLLTEIPPDLTASGLDCVQRGREPHISISLEDESYREQFERAVGFLRWLRALLGVGMERHGSYGLKHRAEDLYRRISAGNAYISNGCMIAAAISEGLEVRRNPGTPNAIIIAPREVRSW